MNFLNKHELIEEISGLSIQWLKNNSAYLSPRLPFRGRHEPDGFYFIQLTRLTPDSLQIQEMILNHQSESRPMRVWSLKKERHWEALNLEKNNHPVAIKNLVPELRDLLNRMQTVQRYQNSEIGFFTEEHNASPSLMAPPETLPDRENSSNSVLNGKFFAALAGCIVLLLGIIGIFYNIYVNSKNPALNDFSRLQNDMNVFQSDMLTELKRLQQDVAASQTKFEADRRYYYFNIIEKASNLPGYFPRRKEAYKLIADNINEAANYGEIIRQTARLPESEAQAAALLETDIKKIVSLSLYEPIFPFLGYPVQIEGNQNDGRGFRITDGYMDSRKDPLGSGGIMPHRAVDIINVANIPDIRYNGSIIRDSLHPGHVTAVASGIVRKADYDDAGYGWRVEIEHLLRKEVLDKYPLASKWNTLYAHLRDKPLVAVGEKVDRLQVLGFIGNTGKSTGPHCHFEVHIYVPDGNYKNSMGARFIKDPPYTLK